MKKTISTLMVLIALVMGLQAQAQRPDTLRVTLNNGNTYYYLTNDIANMDFSDPSLVTINMLNGESNKHLRNTVQSLRFFNRYSNPQNMLTEQGTGVYEGLYYTASNPCGTFYLASLLASDEMLGGGGSGDQAFQELDLLTSNALRSNLATGWELYYQSISNINNMIEQLAYLPPERQGAQANQAHGEALFMRAFYYYQLASLFGPVPVYTDNNSWAQKLTEVTPERVWGRILLDLKDAISLLDGHSPTLFNDDSRVGKYAAEAMLARAYLFYAGFYGGVHDIANGDYTVSLPDGSQLNKQDVIGYVNDCVDNSGFSLVGDFRNLWPYTNRLTVNSYDYTANQGLKWVEDDGAINPEVLFKIKFNKNASWNTTVGYSNQFALYLGMRIGQGLSQTYPFGQGWGAGPVAPSLFTDWEEAEPNDMRREASIQDVRLLPSYVFGSENFMQETMFHEKKISPISAPNTNHLLYDFGADGNGDLLYTFEAGMYYDGAWNAAGNFMQLGNIHPLNLIRFADVLLMQSELTGSTDGINKVRARAGLSPIAAYSLQALQQERRWELAFEGVRWNDMRRWGDDYCIAALDKQMGVEIFNEGKPTTNPTGIGAYSYNDQRTYGQTYAENHGFFNKPEGYEQPGGELLYVLQGNWTLDDGQAHADYMQIEDTWAKLHNASGEEIASGLLSIILTENFDERICQINVNGGALMTVDDNAPDYADIVAISENLDRITLHNESGQTWTLRRMSQGEQLLPLLNGIKWSYATLYGTDLLTGQSVVTGTLGTQSWNTNYVSSGNIPIIYGRHLESTTAEGLESYLQSQGVDTSNGEADPFAYMMFDTSKQTVSKYTRDGQLIGTATYTATNMNSTDIQITVSGNGILSPYIYNGKGETESTFQLRYGRPGLLDLGRNMIAGLILTSTKQTDQVYTYWMFGERGLTQEEFDQALTVSVEDGNKIVATLPNGLNKYLLTATGLDGTVMAHDSGNNWIAQVPRGQEVEKDIRFTMTNCNGIIVSADRTLKLINNEQISAGELRLVGTGNSKTWQWDTSITGAVWGNMGYCGGAGSEVGISGNGQWWGCTSSEDFELQLRYTNDGINHGDGNLNASMTFYSDGTAKCFNAANEEIRFGQFSVVDWDDSDPQAWRMGWLETMPGTILWPFEINGGGRMPTKFEIVYLTDDKLTLVYPDGGEFNSLGGWGEATFWHFKSKSDQ